MKYRNRRR